MGTLVGMLECMQVVQMQQPMEFNSQHAHQHPHPHHALPAHQDYRVPYAHPHMYSHMQPHAGAAQCLVQANIACPPTRNEFAQAVRISPVLSRMDVQLLSPKHPQGVRYGTVCLTI